MRACAYEVAGVEQGKEFAELKMSDAGTGGGQLKAFIERIERLEEEKKAIADDIREVFAEAKGNGFDVKIMRQVIRIRKQDAHERLEQEAVLDTYLAALGMLRQSDAE